MTRRWTPVFLLLLVMTACAGDDPALDGPATTSGSGQTTELDLSGVGFEVHQEPG